jgi:hypothetical protein
MITGKCIECGCVYDLVACDFVCPRCSFAGVKLGHTKVKKVQVVTECASCHHIYLLDMESNVESVGCPECFSKDVVAAWKVSPQRVEITGKAREQAEELKKQIQASVRYWNERVQRDLSDYSDPPNSAGDDEREERSYERREPFYAQEGRGNRGGLQWLEHLYSLVCPRPYGEIYKEKK